MNRTSAGSAVLQARIFYPGQAPGENAPILPRAGGHPVYVFLHGYGNIGSNHWAHGPMLAEKGYVCVLGDTARFDAGLQYQDGIAYWPSLNAESQDPQSFFFGAFDMSRAVIGGYSMGGMNALRVLSANCGYKAGFAHAPCAGTYYGQMEGGNCRQPFAIVQGMGDPVVPWQGGGFDWYAQTRFSGQKVLYLLDEACNHENVVTIPTSAPIDREIFLRAMGVCLGFLDAQLMGDAAAFEDVIGGRARAEAHLAQLHFEIEKPVLWTVQSGGTISLREASAAGGMVLFGSLTRRETATPFGVFELGVESLVIPLAMQVQPSRYVTLDWSWPPNFLGLHVHLQALALGHDQAARLSNLSGVDI